MKISYTPRKECASFWSWLSWSWTYPNPNKPFPARFECWHFFGITCDIEMSDIGEKHWKMIRTDKYPSVYRQIGQN